MNGQFDVSREGQLDEKGLKWGYWWVTHKVKIRQWTSVALGVFGAATLGYGLFGFADYYFGSGVVERQMIGQMTKQLIPYATISAARAPQPLEQIGDYALATGADKYDLVGSVRNPNALWIAYFDYHFEAGSLKTMPVAGYVLPGDTTWLEQLNYKAEGGLFGATLRIENLRWQRVNLHVTTPDYQTWSTSRLDVAVENETFLRPTTGDALGTSRASFRLRNNTAFGYYRVGLAVLLWGDGGALLGANRIIVSDLRAGDVRDVEAVWFGDVPGVKTVEVKPLIDVFDAKNYIPVGK